MPMARTAAINLGSIAGVIKQDFLADDLASSEVYNISPSLETQLEQISAVAVVNTEMPSYYRYLISYIDASIEDYDNLSDMIDTLLISFS